MSFQLNQLYPSLPHLTVVDIGASPVEGEPIYRPLLSYDQLTIIGFEPQPDQFAALQAQAIPRHVFYPYALGIPKALVNLGARG